MILQSILVLISFVAGFWFCYILRVKKGIVGNNRTIVVSVEADTTQAVKEIQKLINDLKVLNKYNKSIRP